MAAHKYFWTPSRVEALKEILPQAMKCLNVQNTTMAYFVSANTSVLPTSARLVATYSSYRRLLIGEKGKLKPRILSGILLALRNQFQTKQDFGEFVKTDFQIIFEMYEEFFEQLKNEVELLPFFENLPTFNIHPAHSSVSKDSHKINQLNKESAVINKGDNNTRQIARLIMAYTGTSKIEINKTQSMFFDNNNPYSRYLTYRYSTRPGVIQKSLTVIKNTNHDFPFLTFKNFFEYRGRRRESSGILLPFGTHVAFIGSVDGGSAFKAMVLKRCQSPQNYHTGLLITSDPGGNPVAARFSMLGTNMNSHREIEKFELNIEEAKNEDERITGDIRNKIPFLLDKKLLNNGKLITQHSMVGLVDRIMSSNTKYNIVDEAGASFNPASDDNYTFNSALAMSD